MTALNQRLTMKESTRGGAEIDNTDLGLAVPPRRKRHRSVARSKQHTQRRKGEEVRSHTVLRLKAAELTHDKRPVQVMQCVLAK